MKQLVLNIEENKLKSFLSYLKTLDYVSVSSKDDVEVPKWQQDIVFERIKNSNEEDLIPWEKARKKLRFKTK